MLSQAGTRTVAGTHTVAGTRTVAGTHMVACPLGNGSDKNRTDKSSFSLQHLSVSFHFFIRSIYVFRVVLIGLKSSLTNFRESWLKISNCFPFVRSSQLLNGTRVLRTGSGQNSPARG